MEWQVLTNEKGYWWGRYTKNKFIFKNINFSDFLQNPMLDTPDFKIKNNNQTSQNLIILHVTYLYELQSFLKKKSVSILTEEPLSLTHSLSLSPVVMYLQQIYKAQFLQQFQKLWSLIFVWTSIKPSDMWLLQIRTKMRPLVSSQYSLSTLPPHNFDMQPHYMCQYLLTDTHISVRYISCQSRPLPPS
jgi:hypothetical protein